MNRPVFIDGFAARWAASGLAALTGHPGEAVLPRRDYLSRLDMLLEGVEALAGQFGAALGLDYGVFTTRAAEMGLSRRGRISCNGACRLIEGAGGWMAVNLARPEDVELVPAWLCREVDDAWAAIAEAARDGGVHALIARAEMLGLPTILVPASGNPLTLPSPPRGEGTHDKAFDAVVPSPQRGEGQGEGGRAAASVADAPSRGALQWHCRGQDDDRRGSLRVIDLSSLWAGPLCGHLLTRIGCRVVKVESIARPDGARLGSPALFARLHQGQECLSLDFATPEGRGRLRDLILSADLVIEGSRPRALRRLGIDRDEIMARRPGLIWVGITAHGRDSDRVGFGDDAAAAAGLLAWDRAGKPVFVGDAIADPIAGLAAAAGAMDALLRGEGGCVDVSLSGAAAWVADAPDARPC